MNTSDSFLIMVGYPRNPLAGKFLKGPREPEDVKRDGYGFTTNPEEAWPFPTEKAALAKARILARHMGFSVEELLVEDNHTAADEMPQVPARLS